MAFINLRCWFVSLILVVVVNVAVVVIVELVGAGGVAGETG